LQKRGICRIVEGEPELPAMKRSRAIAIAAEQKALQGRLVLVATVLLLPVLLLLLISP
jgi:hypothetical protein